MEHRRYMRVPATVDTLIYHHGLPVASGRIRDAGRGGIFIETAFAGAYDHQVLECEFQIAQDRVRLDGQVARHEPSGIALWIDDNNGATTGAMRTLLAACGGVPSMRLPQGDPDRGGSKLRAFTNA
jgi:hypothetical protein